MSQFHFVPRHCSCTSKEFGDFNLLAIHQKTVDQNAQSDDPASFNDIMNAIGCRRMCCRRFLLNQIKLFLTCNSDVRIYAEGYNISSFWKIAKKSSKEQIYTVGGPDIVPKHDFP